jgi:citrate lyase subunit beta/citryl-CoA lyase
MFAGVSSYLFVPATEPRRIDKARNSDAGAIIVDLEDAVAETDKDQARDLLRHHLVQPRAHGTQLVRINGLETPHAEADMRAVRDLPIDGVVVPKALADDLAAFPTGGLRVLALVETARGIRGAYEIASLASVAAIMIGVVDLASELGATPSADGREFLFARSSLVVDSIAAGLAGPIDGPCTAVGKPDVVRAEAHQARTLGFVAKACIHPAQLPVVHDVFRPSIEELAWARRVVAGAEEAARDGRGVIAVDGEMIDGPVLARARRFLAIDSG